MRGLPAVLYRPVVGSRRTVAAGLLQATSLPFIVVATRIGVSLGLLTAATGAALVAAGLLSVVAFPVVALGLLRDRDTADGSRSKRAAGPGGQAGSSEER